MVARPNHSITSACRFGVEYSTVVGRLRISFRCGVGWKTSITASHTSSAYSGSVDEKLSGEYSQVIAVPRRYASAYCMHHLAPCTAISLMPARSWRKTTRRCSSEVEL